MRTLILLCVVGATFAQFEGGFVKILQDKRYQDGGSFGNFREQEDGIKYFEETDVNNIRRGYYEYPSSDGTVLRTEFEAGPGIGFRITNSNHQAPTPVAKPQPQFQPQPQPQFQPQPQPQPQFQAPAPTAAPIRAPLPVVRNPIPTFQTTTTEGPINIFDYPGNLEFSRSSSGHRFVFTAV
ncbi:uncharacterized protein [Palaemon carinicauda]|uniref:uncharacterized protein n=1 Tax=Palaemon carinicauda TaxID=392227 RepID=UPI0035B68093